MRDLIIDRALTLQDRGWVPHVVTRAELERLSDADLILSFEKLVEYLNDNQEEDSWGSDEGDVDRNSWE